MKLALKSENTNIRKQALKLLAKTSGSLDIKFEIINPLLEAVPSLNAKEIDLVSKIIFRLKEISSLRLILPSLNSALLPENSNLLTSLYMIIEKLRKLIDQDLGYISEITEFQSLTDYKQLNNQFKTIINHLAENLQCSAKISMPRRNEFLDISGDPSFFKDDSLQDMSLIEVDDSFQKNSLDSGIGGDFDEKPPSVHLCQTLVKAGIKSDVINH